MMVLPGFVLPVSVILFDAEILPDSGPVITNLEVGGAVEGIDEEGVPF